MLKVFNSEDALRGLGWYCIEYHSGQWSREYRLSCKVQDMLLRRYGTDNIMDMPLGSKGTNIYQTLVGARID